MLRDVAVRETGLRIVVAASQSRLERASNWPRNRNPLFSNAARLRARASRVLPVDDGGETRKPTIDAPARPIGHVRAPRS